MLLSYVSANIVTSRAFRSLWIVKPCFIFSMPNCNPSRPSIFCRQGKEEQPKREKYTEIRDLGCQMHQNQIKEIQQEHSSESKRGVSLKSGRAWFHDRERATVLKWRGSVLSLAAFRAAVVKCGNAERFHLIHHGTF